MGCPGFVEGLGEAVGVGEPLILSEGGGGHDVSGRRPRCWCRSCWSGR
jgi:hypothetical protein